MTQFNVHPNSTAARMWGKSTWNSALTQDERRFLPKGSTGGRPGYTSQEEARTVACPLCKAAVGQHCTGLRGARIQQHGARHQAALAAGATPASRRRRGAQRGRPNTPNKRY